ncbi:alpha-1,2-fucosyltransferase [Butyrivibrio sp. AE3006]|uniref:alpha-1,2-fucosyltransferase n=1 Tax=Butyrivibrio sp. AE3006 TaxID=1280673 RepID=UPI000419398C|nr:alpha-1,2-fucosyltransferase [Butyrivibrio sp. AE3006]
MIIIRLKGGLGNQMFQYALYLQLKALGKEVKIDEVNGFKDDPQRDPVLFDLFGITYDTATDEEVVEITDAHMDLLSRIKRKLFGRKSAEYQDNTGNFDPKVLEMDTAYLNGYFQSDKYFTDRNVLSRLKREFEIKPEDCLTTSKSWEIYRQILQSNSASIHVRRGDYLEPGTVETFGGICDDDYYKRAIDTLISKYPDVEFFIFSNDNEWYETHVSGDRFHYVETGEEKEDVADLLLMSLCKHHILANSSFSWWSAWMNDAPEKTILVPPKWLNNKPMEDIYTERMIKV